MPSSISAVDSTPPLRAGMMPWCNSSRSCQPSASGALSPGPQYAIGAVSIAMNGEVDATVSPPAPTTR